MGELRVAHDGQPLQVRYEEVDRLGQVALYLTSEGGDRAYAVSIEGRLQLSWLKTKLLQVQFLSRLRDPRHREIAEAGRDLARRLNLGIREQEFLGYLKRPH